MADVKFVTREGDELTLELAVQRLMHRVSTLETQLEEAVERQGFMLERIHYLESNV